MTRRENPECTPERLAKLPRWAREHIEHVEREREVAVRTLDSFRDDQTVSKCYAEVYDCTGEERGPTNRRVYFNAKESIIVEHAGVKLDVSFYEDDGIGLRFHGERCHSDVAVMPVCHGNIKLQTPEQLRGS